MEMKRRRQKYLIKSTIRWLKLEEIEKMILCWKITPIREFILLSILIRRKILGMCRMELTIRTVQMGHGTVCDL